MPHYRDVKLPVASGTPIKVGHATNDMSHIRIADHDDINQIIENYKILHKEILTKVEGKKTVKKILKQLKVWCSSNENLAFDEDGDGYASDSSIMLEDGNSSGEIEDQDNYPLISTEINTINSSSSSTKSETAIVSDKIDKVEKRKNKLLVDRDQSPDRLEFNQSDFSDSNSDSSDADNCEGGGGVDDWRSLGNNLIYSLIGCNCAMLFLMKNSGKVNVTMAKRAVRQRIGWAKQWAGSLFRNRSNPVTPTTSQMAKSASHNSHLALNDASIQSGSISDTTYGGSVTAKFAPKRGAFFRNKGSQATQSQTQAQIQAITKENNMELSNNGILDGIIIGSDSINFNDTKKVKIKNIQNSKILKRHSKNNSGGGFNLIEPLEFS
ncbi:5198_t:CDS:2 [Diversispora eburnea]|uniref:5198_t:CDS:1 n=1 Tax=Diversispora eburnea TaxID=1213867 RepID=A0A9N8VUJ6_9GLOM|nr:5198_t:CDS:2 [Diversispora eburnea]